MRADEFQANSDDDEYSLRRSCQTSHQSARVRVFHCREVLCVSGGEGVPSRTRGEMTRGEGRRRDHEEALLVRRGEGRGITTGQGRVP